MTVKKTTKTSTKDTLKTLKIRKSLMENRPDTRARLREDLMDHITMHGYAGQHYEDLVETYMSFWDVLQKLLDDIEARGVSVKWQNSAISFGVKRNESIAEAVKVSSSMARIWQLLDFKPVEDDGKDADDEM